MSSRINYKTGEKIGKCIYIEDVDKKHNIRHAKFKCQCGNLFVASIYSVKTLHTNSCGCFKVSELKNKSTKHGLWKLHIVEYLLWQNMKQRCTNSNHKYFKNYGGRGISICDRWINSFENFFADMGKKPNGMELDRINNNLGYSKDNCRWATHKENNNNKRTNTLIEYKGKTKTITMWSEEFKIPRNSLKYKILHGNKSIDELFDTLKIKTA